MPAAMLACPQCSSQDVLDRREGRAVPWVLRQEPGTRKAIGILGILGGVVLAVDGLLIAWFAAATDLHLFYSALTLAGGLALFLLGAAVVARSLRAFRGAAGDYVCGLCGVTWTTRGAPVGGPEPTATVPRQRRAGDDGAVRETPQLQAWQELITGTIGSQTPPDAISHVLDEQRIETVRLIAGAGLKDQIAGGDGRAAVRTLVDLLDLDTHHLPPPVAGKAQHTMTHEVIRQLGALAVPSAIGPLTAFRDRMREGLQKALEDGPDPLAVRRAVLAEDLAALAERVIAQLTAGVDEPTLPQQRQRQYR